MNATGKKHGSSDGLGGKRGQSENAASADPPRSAMTVDMLAAVAGASAEDGIWLDVIHKMDEVYNDLL
ncbi:MAG: hypothetical protein K9J74_10910, partial [Sulfuritalea sp.]|nr:hypothetical protein [Sulfuritalea sp.]